MSILGLELSPNHFPCVSLSDGRTRFIASRHQPDRCIVFVHGFNGDSMETWEGFDSIALQSHDLKNVDLIFFGYDGVRSNALASASFLFELLDDVFIAGTLLHSVRPTLPGYEICVLTAHSLGAVVGRWALLQAHRERRTWLDKVRVLLFAPAHCGGVIVQNLSELVGQSTIGKLIGDAAKTTLPLLEELSPESAVLRSLEQRTRAAVSNGCAALRARRVVVAEYENIVSNLPFADDPFPTAIRNATHTSVCKPSKFLRSLDYVAELLK